MAYGGDLQANTAVDLMVGPFLDETNGKDAETGLTITQAEVRLSKNGANMAQKNEGTSLTHDELGNYVCKLDTTDTNTEGILTLMIHESGALPIKMDYTILAQAAYISKYTAKDAGFMDVNIKTIGRTDTQETEANNLESACSNYSVTRGLTGTAVPAAVADAAGGLMISDDGGWDADELYDAIVTDAAGANIAIDIIAVKAETASIQTETTALDTLTKAAGDGDLAAILVDTAEIGAAGVGLTEAGGDGDHLVEAGGDGDHLTAINLPNQTMDIVGSITGNLSGTVGSVTGAVGSVTGHTAQTGDTFALANGAAGFVAIDTVVDAVKVVTDNLAASATTIVSGTVSWDNSNATTVNLWSDDITTAAADHYNGRLIIFTSGTLQNQATDITDYVVDAGEGKFTFTALTSAPADNVTFVIV